MPEARNHLLITRELIVKGTVTPLGTRLVDHLATFAGRFLAVRNATVTSRDGVPAEEWDEIALAIDAVVLAHEYVALSGDPHMRAMNVPPGLHRHRLRFGALGGLTVDGDLAVSPHEGSRRFLVAQHVQIDDPGEGHRAADAIESLDYLLVNRNRLDAFHRI